MTDITQHELPRMPGYVFEVYRSEDNPRGNAAVSIRPSLRSIPQQLRLELLSCARQLDVNQLIVWCGDQVIATLPVR